MNEYDKFYRLLGWVLVEIRATQDLREARYLADIVHNLPSKISAGISVDDIDCDLKNRAGRLGMTTWLDKRLSACESGPTVR